MRRALLAASLAILGCGKAPTPSVSTAPPPPDPVATRREDDAQAAYSLDAAVGSIAEALAGAKRLASTAGGDAKGALLDVAEMFDSAGAALAEHDDPPPPVEAYRGSGAERSRERQDALKDALDALHELRDAQGTLDDLAQTVPPDSKKPLETIQRSTDEALDAVKGAIVRLGGKVPAEEGP